MKSSKVETSREVRLWITTIIFPLTAFGALAAKKYNLPGKIADWKEKRKARKKNR